MPVSPFVKKRASWSALSPDTRGLVNNSPHASKMETRSMRGHRLHEIPKATNDAGEEEEKDDESIITGWLAAGDAEGATEAAVTRAARVRTALTLMATRKVYKYDQYDLAVSCDVNKPLSKSDFEVVQRVAFTLSQHLVRQALKTGMKISSTRRKLLNKQELNTAEVQLLKEMFPHGATGSGLWAVAADTWLHIAAWHCALR